MLGAVCWMLAGAAGMPANRLAHISAQESLQNSLTRSNDRGVVVVAFPTAISKPFCGSRPLLRREHPDTSRFAHTIPVQWAVGQVALPHFGHAVTGTFYAVLADSLQRRPTFRFDHFPRLAIRPSTTFRAAFGLAIPRIFTALEESRATE